MRHRWHEQWVAREADEQTIRAGFPEVLVLALALRRMVLSQPKALKSCSTFLPGKSFHQWRFTPGLCFYPLGYSCNVQVSFPLTLNALQPHVTYFRFSGTCWVSAACIGECGQSPVSLLSPNPAPFTPVLCHKQHQTGWMVSASSR